MSLQTDHEQSSNEVHKNSCLVANNYVQDNDGGERTLGQPGVGVEQRSLEGFRGPFQAIDVGVFPVSHSLAKV